MVVAIASGVAILLGFGMIALNLSSVAADTRATATAIAAAAAAPRATAAPAAAGTPVAARAATPPATLTPSFDPPGVERKTKGSKMAPVVITEYFDYQCPACGRFSLTYEPEIDRLYIDTNKARYISRNYAFIGPESFLAAEAAEAAADQGRYWDYRRLLFWRQKGENLGAFKIENLKGFASELGLDRQKFDAAMDGRIYRERIEAESKEADTRGINATPSFFINDTKVDGIPNPEKMGKLIEEEIAKKR